MYCFDGHRKWDKLVLDSRSRLLERRDILSSKSKEPLEVELFETDGVLILPAPGNCEHVHTQNELLVLPSNGSEELGESCRVSLLE